MLQNCAESQPLPGGVFYTAKETDHLLNRMVGTRHLSAQSIRGYYAAARYKHSELSAADIRSTDNPVTHPQDLFMFFRALCLLTLLFSPVLAQAQIDPLDSKGQNDFTPQQHTFLKVEQAYQVEVSQSESALFFDWVIQPGYYLYQHQFKAEARNSEGREALTLQFETGKSKYDEIFEREVEVYYGATRVSASLPTLTPPYELALTSQGCADAGLCYAPRQQYFSVDTGGNVSELTASQFGAATIPSTSDAPTSAANQEQPLLIWVVLGAILGGLILNLMPCVFPVLSLKALSFASSHLNPHKQHLHGWLYTAGVVGSFLVAALFIIIAKSTGQELGWGFQLQSPTFVALMAYLFFVMGLSLSGMFHIGTQWMGAGQSLTTGNGYKSSFFTGVLAALVASPCTAPFMATALGFALTQPAWISLLIFTALGFGMALPFLLLSYSPALARYLPAPGAWMDRLKQILAFPLYITAIWLLWVLSNQTSSTGAALVLLGAVSITFAIWNFQQDASSRVGKVLTKGLGVASLVFAAMLAWNSGDYAQRKSSMWEAYSPQRLQELRSEGVPVFVDLTADWCITCKFNERVALNREKVARFVALNDIVMLQGDWTNSDPDITALLAQFERSGVPLYLMYPAKADAPPAILPQILSEALVLEYMQKSLQ